MIPKIYDLDKDMGIHRIAKKSEKNQIEGDLDH